MSPASNAVVNRATSWRSAGAPGSGAAAPRPGGAPRAPPRPGPRTGCVGVVRASGWSAALDRLACALQRPVHRDFGDPQHLGDLPGAEGQDVAQHEHRPLAGREQLHRGNEREPDRLACLVARLRLGGAVRQAFEQDVRIGLEPDRLADTGGRWRRRRFLRWHRDLPGPPGPVAERVEAPVGRDPVQPGPDRGAALKVIEAAPCRQQRLLYQVFGVLHRAGDAVAVQLKLRPVSVREFGERRLPAPAYLLQQLLAHPPILALTRPPAPSRAAAPRRRRSARRGRSRRQRPGAAPPRSCGPPPAVPSPSR